MAWQDIFTVVMWVQARNDAERVRSSTIISSLLFLVGFFLDVLYTVEPY